ncbi:MAG: PAS domain-containing protein, partial [Planctomycetota bacterium]
MSPFHLFPLARWFYKPATWVVAVILLAIIDLMTPPWVHVCVLALLLVTLAWNSLPRRFMPLLMATTLVAVSVPGLIRGIAASQNDGVTVVAGQLVPTPHSSSPMALGQLAVPFLAFGPARCWTLLALVGQWWFHRRLQQRRARRLALRRSLQQRVHRRTDQVKRANQALRGEIVRRQETQHQLDQSESTFEALIERMELQVSRKDSQGVITYANDIYCQKLGLDPTKVIGSTDEELFSPVIAEKYRNDDRTIMETGQVIDQIEQHPTPEGNAGFVQVFKAPEYDRDGNCIGIQVIFWDITQKHLGEIALRDSEARKRALFDSAGDAVVLLDQDDLVVEANPAAIDLFRDPLVGKTFAEIAEPFASAESNVDTDEESSGGRNERGPARVGRDLASNGRGAETWGAIDRETRHELNIRLRDGRRFDSEVSVHTIPVGDHDGVAVIIRDVTLQKRAMEALRDAKASAEAANRTKTEFIAGVSHELRTPLGGIIGLSDLLSQTPLNESGQEYVQMIGESAQALTDVIEDILDFAAIDAGRLDIDPRPMDLHRCVGGAFKSLAVRAAELPISLVFSMQPDTPRYVIADAKRVRQVMINLIGNAIKFTREGEVRVRLSVDPILETEPVEELDVPATDQHVFLVEVA